MSASTVAVIIPMKPLAQAKTRLESHLSDPQRRRLALSLLAHVLKTVNQARKSSVEGPAVQETWVVGGDSEVRHAAESEGAEWMDDGGQGLNGALELGFHRAAESGKAGLFLPADLPLLAPADVHGLLETSGKLKNLVLAPAGNDGGTNGILLPPQLADTFRFKMGPDSFKLHLEQAGFLGIPVAIYYSAGLAFDLDTPADLEACGTPKPGSVPGQLDQRCAKTN